MRRYHFIALTILAVIALAQSPPGDAVELEQAGWIHLGHNGDVRALCRVGDSLWVGTGGGLFIYDLGSSRIAAHVTVGPDFPSNSVRAISVRKDSVYVGTDDGLVIFTPDSVAVFTPGHPRQFEGAPLDLIRRIDFGLDGVVYLSTYGSGLGVLDSDTAWVITREDTLLDDKVYDMVQEDDTTFYFATSMGLCAYRDSLWVNFQAGAGIPRAEVRRIVEAPDGGYYLLIGGRGVYWFDGDRARRITYRDLFVENAVAAIAVDAWGSLWACGAYGGIAVYRNGHWTSFEYEDPGGAKQRWRSASADTTGGVYIGSADGMVLTIQDNVAGKFRLPFELPSGSIEAITADSSGALYVLNGSYLVRVDEGLESISMEHPSPVVAAMAVSPAGGLWTATRWGIYQRDGDRYVEFDARVSERNPVFSAIGFDGVGALWVGTQAGNVHRYDGELWMRMGDADELTGGAVRAFAADGRGRLWVTGANGGVSVYNGARWTVFGPAAYGELPARALAVAPTGVPVLATGSGIWGHDDVGGWKPVEFSTAGADADSTGSGAVWNPASPDILSLAFDDAGRLYVGTENGIALIDEYGTRWLTYMDGLGGKAVTGVFAQGGEAVWVGFRSDGLTCVPVSSVR
jgi:ligand-binding sensor domain-containing protein